MSTMTITIKDETFSGKILHELDIEFDQEQVTVLDIITERVTTEVNAYNNKLPAYYQGLIEPTDAEKTLNGFKLKKQQLIDPEKQVYVALDAFQHNGFFVLIDHKQAEQLDEIVLLKSNTSISFVKLTPLVGG